MRYILAAVVVALFSTAAIGDSALTHKGRVAQIAPAPFPVHPSMVWVDIAGVSPQPKAGWKYNGGKNFTAPPTEPQRSDGQRFDSLTRGAAMKAIIRGLAEMRGASVRNTRAWLREKAGQ